MKTNQKLKICFENYNVVIRFDELDSKLLSLAKKLEIDGDLFGPVTQFDGVMCITMAYADKPKEGIPESKIFGYPESEFLAMQFK